jgi:uncharacterized membrane protein
LGGRLFKVILVGTHSGLKQVMSLFTLRSARVVLVVALVYSFPDVFNVIMALISPYTTQPFIEKKDIRYQYINSFQVNWFFLSITLKFILSLVSRGWGSSR